MSKPLLTAGFMVLLVILCEAVQAQQCMKDVTDGLPIESFFGSGETTSPDQRYYRAFDNNPNATNKWLYASNTSTASPNFIGVNFGTGITKTLTGYLVSAGEDEPVRDPRDWQFQGHDGSTWIDLDTRSNQEFAYRGQSRIFTFSNTTAYQQYRLLVTETFDPNATIIQIGEMELYEKVCLEGVVTDQASTPLSGVTVAMMGETYTILDGGGNLLHAAVTDNDGKYIFETANIPDGQFSLIVQPPAGYQILSNAGPFFADPTWRNESGIFSIPKHYYVYDGSITFRNHKQLAQTAYWDAALPPAQSFSFFNRFLAGTANANGPGNGGSGLNFQLTRAELPTTCATLNGSPLADENLITVAGHGTFGTFDMGTGSGSYVRSHPGQPGFIRNLSNTLLYDNEGFLNPANTSYNYINNPNQIGLGYYPEADLSNSPGSGVLSAEATYTVTSYIGTVGDMIDGQDAGLNLTSLINSYKRGWRKSYGTTTGDVYDKFMLVNGAAGDLPLFVQTGLSLKGGLSYLFSFDGKHANASTQTGLAFDPIQVPYRLLNASLELVESGTLALPASTGITDDAPSSPWQKVFTSLTPSVDGVYTLELRFPGGNTSGNDFYIDNISLRALTDYGDDPITYLEAVHGQSASQISASCEPYLYFGEKLDIENSYVGSASANSDNLDNSDDEDGVTLTAIPRTATSYSVTISATNNSASPATIYGWIDWDNNGTFEIGERVSQSVPGNSGEDSYTLTWNGITAPAGDVYSRFRLGSDLAAGNPSGISSGGEVEDYLIPLAGPMPVKLISFTAALAGENTARLTWTVADEVDFDRYVVESSFDAKRFTEVASQVGSHLASYNATAQLAGGRQYFRLKMIDKDQTFAYSRIVSVSSGENTGLVLYPNPVNNELKINPTGSEAVANVKIFSMAGHLVREVENPLSNQMNLTHLPAGEYVVKVLSKKGLLETGKFVKR